MRVPCNKNADTHIHTYRYFRHFFRTPKDKHKLSHAHTHTHSSSDSVFCFRWKTKYSMKFFPPAGRTRGDSSTVQVRCRFFPLVFLYFPPLHTGAETIELDSVCQAFNVLKIIGWVWKVLLCFPVQSACSKEAFLAFKQNIRTRDESQNFVFRRRPSAVS